MDVLKKNFLTRPNVLKNDFDYSNMLYDISKLKILSPWDEQKQYQKILEQLRKAASATMGALVVFEPNRQRYLFRAAVGLACSESAICNLIWTPTTKFGDAFVNKIDASNFNKRTFQHHLGFDFEKRLGFESFCFQPLMVENKMIGGGLLGNRKSAIDFSRIDLKHLEKAAVIASAELERIHLYKELKSLFIHSVHAFVSAIDAKDQYTHGHSERVTDYAMKMGKILGWSTEMMEALSMAAILHDVGKLGVPELILSKPSALNNDEFFQIKRHPEIGAKIIGEIPQLKATLSGILFHHERYDGKGYPRGLEGENIPIFGRLICVADAYDAMTSDRPYRKGLEAEQALLEVVNNQGTQFDPKMVNAIIEAHKQGSIV